MGADLPPGLDVDELYRLLAHRLEQIVRVGVRAPEPVIEDACQFAWARLVHHQARVQPESAFGWLIKTAVHEALKLVRRAGREISLDGAVADRSEWSVQHAGRTPHALVEHRERLRSLGALPTRQQRLLWLYGLGLSYEEIARSQGCTARTVERQLQRARAALGEGERITEALREGEQRPRDRSALLARAPFSCRAAGAARLGGRTGP